MADVWAKYRRLKRCYFGLFILYIPVMAMIGFLVIKIWGTFDPMWFLFLFVAWASAFAYCGLSLGLMRCPRCGNRFGGLRRKCRSCGLAVGEPV